MYKNLKDPDFEIFNNNNDNSNKNNSCTAIKSEKIVGRPQLNYTLINNKRTVNDLYNNVKTAKSPIAKSKVNTLVNSQFATTLKPGKREVKDLHYLQQEIYQNPKTRFGTPTPERVNFGQQLRQIVDEEVRNIKQENDRLRTLNRKFEQNMADIVKKLE